MHWNGVKREDGSVSESEQFYLKHVTAVAYIRKSNIFIPYLSYTCSGAFVGAYSSPTVRT